MNITTKFNIGDIIGNGIKIGKITTINIIIEENEIIHIEYYAGTWMDEKNSERYFPESQISDKTRQREEK